MYFIGFAKHGEVFDPHKVSLILMFTMFQFIFMTVCLIWTRFMFNYEIISALYLVWITGMAIWNGGSYYIQIFSQRYNSKFLTPSNETIDHQSSFSNNSDNTDKSDWYNFFLQCCVWKSVKLHLCSKLALFKMS